jgi:DNA topoisomerase-2
MSKKITVIDFFASDVREYSVHANVRAIPDLIDGFKPSQRKAIFGTLKKASTIPETGIKVSQLAAAVGLVSAYHHGEASLESTIVKLAQDYPGANNLNLLKPLGQFGSRLSDTNAASRYIFTDLHPVFRKLFKRDDDLILKHLQEDGEEIEPERYMPVLPMVLVNGANGMGTGFATNISAYNPEDLRKYLIDKLKTGKSNVKLVPWYRGFTGKIERLVTGQIQCTGRVEKETSTKLVVTELPIGVQLDTYKEVLFGLQDAGLIKDFENESTVNGFRFVLDVPRTTGYMDEAELISKLKLTTKSTENLTVWLPTGKLKCFKTPEELTDAFLAYRLERYEDRRLARLAELNEKLEVLNEKVRFIELYLSDGMATKVSKMTKAALEAMLREQGFKQIDQLLDIKIYNLTQDNIDKLLAEVQVQLQLIEYFEKATKESLYLKDLQELDLKEELKPQLKVIKSKKEKAKP